MKTITLSILLTFTSLTAQAQNLEAKSINDLVTAIEAAKFTFKEVGKIFGFHSTQSCLYLSKDIAIFKNYCYPVKKYPARGFTIISSEFGMIDLYEENLPNVLKRDILISQFSEILRPYLTTPIPEHSLSGLSSLIEKMHYKYFPACWSTNYSFYVETSDVNCNVAASEVLNVLNWANETQSILADETQWLDLMEKIEKVIN